jgi:NAD(P)-dependent dehydrogenase (short-subunit alcohol dehydrogenase family)
MTAPDSPRVALITGGTSGIGLAAAIQFAREGHSVVIAARDADRGSRALDRLRAEAPGAAAEFLPADMGEPDQIERMVAATVDRFGRVDCALNNAATDNGIIGLSTADYSLEQFDRHLDLNLRSVWLCMKHEITQMRAQGWGGAIVNTASVNALGGVRGAAPYAVAKAGVVALTKSAAQEYAAEKIRVNVLVPGAFDTPMLRGAMVASGGVDEASLGAIRAVYERLIPLGRIGDASEAAAAAVWLCSPQASYVTGHSLIVDGGMTAWAR